MTNKPMESKRSLSFWEFMSSYAFRAMDFLIIGSAFYIGHYVRFGNIDLIFEEQMVSLVGSLFVAFSASTLGVYASWRSKSRLEMYSRVFLAWSISLFGLLGVIVLAHKGEEFSRLWFAYTFGISLVAACLVRAILYWALGFLRSKGFDKKEIIIIGEEDLSLRLKEHILAESWLGLNINKMLNPQFKSINDSENYSGGMEGLEDYISKNKIVEIWITMPLRQAEFIESLLFALRYSTVDIRYVPDMSSFRLLNHKVSDVAGLSVIDLSLSPLSGLSYLVKRIEDLVLASVIMIVISPVLLILAIAIKLTSPGPVLFKQLRHGADGRPINVYKFRTMKVHKEDSNQVSQAVKGDPRVTALGAFMRKTSLDEFPQFYNVLQGRMSVVGPRPHALAHNEHYKELIESYMKRHKVKPGITGWAQVNGYRGETDTIEKMEKRVEYDLYYIDNWSLYLDLKIVILSIFKGFTNENAY